MYHNVPSSPRLKKLRHMKSSEEPLLKMINLWQDGRLARTIENYPEAIYCVLQLSFSGMLQITLPNAQVWTYHE